MAVTEKVYAGWLTECSNGEEDDLLCLGGREFLAESIQDDIREFGHYLSVRYFISDKRMSEDELVLVHMNKLMGEGEAEYTVAYSEITGYLWTDEEIKVGGHDLLEELKFQIGMYLHMTIGYSEIKP